MADPGTMPPAAPSGATPPATDDEKALAAVAYILTWVTGLIIFLVAKKDQHYVRWNALQAIGLGIVATLAGIVLGILGSILALGGGGGGFLFTGILGQLLWLAVLVLVILLAVKAYQGSPVRLPAIAGFADKNA